MFTSPKGGVGKTTLSAHVAAILAKRGHQVVALDLDPQNAMRLHFGLPIAYEAGFMAQLGLGSDWRAALVGTASGVDLLPFGDAEPVKIMRLNTALLANPELLTNPVRDILKDPRTVLVVDSPPGPSAAVAALAGMADLIVMVLLADAGSACLIPQVLSGRVFGRGTIGSRLAKRAAVVVNQVDLEGALASAVLDSVSRVLGPRLLGAVCWDERLAEDLAHSRLRTAGQDGAGRDLAILADAIETRLPPPHAPELGAQPFTALAEWGLV